MPSHYQQPRPISQAKFAKMVGVSASTVQYAIETGRLDGALDENRRIRNVELASYLIVNNKAQTGAPLGVPKTPLDVTMSIATLAKEQVIMEGNIRAYTALRSSVVDREAAHAAVMRSLAPIADRFRQIVDEAVPLAAGQSQADAVLAIRGAVHRALSHDYPPIAPPAPRQSTAAPRAPTPYESPSLQLSNLRRDKLIIQTHMIQLKDDIASGGMVPVEDVLGDLEDRLVQARQHLMALADNIFMARSGMTAGEVRSAVGREVNAAISILYRQAVPEAVPEAPTGPAHADLRVTTGDCGPPKPPLRTDTMTLKQLTQAFNDLARDARLLGLPARHHTSDFGDRVGGQRQVERLEAAIAERLGDPTLGTVN